MYLCRILHSVGDCDFWPVTVPQNTLISHRQAVTKQESKFLLMKNRLHKYIS